MKTVRVWFNHWFSTAYHIINLLKNDEEIKFIVTGSNANIHCVYRAVCDEWITEERFSNSDSYVDFCLEFCRKHKIEVFVPRLNMKTICMRLDEFSAIGVKVLVEKDYSVMSALGDKIKTYQLFAEYGIGHIPPYCVVNSLEDYTAAYSTLKTDDNRVCFKFAIDEGAVSFRVVDDNIEYKLTESLGAKITYRDSVKALSMLGGFPKLLVMPYLSGTEVSVDCLPMPDGNHIVIPRFKSLNRSQEIRFEQEVIDVCCLFLDKFKLECPCNLQFKYEKGTLYLLEVNTRMSGGIQFSCAATGVNMPNMAVNRLLGIEKQVHFGNNNRKPRIVSFIETPVLLEQISENGS